MYCHVQEVSKPIDETNCEGDIFWNGIFCCYFSYHLAPLRLPQVLFESAHPPSSNHLTGLVYQVGGGTESQDWGGAFLSRNTRQKAGTSYLVIQTSLLSIKAGQDFFLCECEDLAGVNREGVLQALHPRQFCSPSNAICFPPTLNQPRH